jgi:hypothetical protein
MFLSEDEITKIQKLPVGERTDYAVYYTLAPHLLGFWTFLKPKYQGCEISDTLFIFGDVCILFEAKTRAKTDQAPESWIYSKISEAVYQINRNSSLLKNNKIPVLRNEWRGEVKYESLNIKNYLGVIVMMVNSAEIDPVDIAADSLCKSKIPIQVLSLYDLYELLRFVNTPWDFVLYLEFRYSFSKKYITPLHKENAIYNSILREWIILAKEQDPELDEKYLIEDQKFMRMYSSTIIDAKKVDESFRRKIAAGYLIDIAAGSLMQKADLKISRKQVGSDEHNTLIMAIEKIAALDRRRRCKYGELWLALAYRSAEEKNTFMNFGYSQSRSCVYAFQACQNINEDILSLTQYAYMQKEERNALSVIGLAATTEKIIATYEQVYRYMLREFDKPEIDTEILDTKAVFIGKRNNK